MSFHTIPADETREWFDAVPSGPLTTKVPEPNEDYMYVATRLLSFFPVINSKGKTYFPEDISDGLLQDAVGRQVNLYHGKTKYVVGNIRSLEKTDEGVDAVIEIDRDQANAHELAAEDFKPGMAFSNVSVELTKDVERGAFLVCDDSYNVIRSISVLAGREQGISPTTSKNPYRLQGKRVVERVSPLRFTGIGFVPNPADKTAKLYAVAADEATEEREIGDGKDPYGDVHYADPGFQSDGKKRYPLNTPEHVRAAASYFGDDSNRAHYTPDQRNHIDAQIAAAKKRHGIGDSEKQQETAMSDEDVKALQDKLNGLEAEVKQLKSEKETAAAEAARVPELESKNKEFSDAIAAKETELASVTAERDTLKSEKETAARDKRIDDLVAELLAILPESDEQKRNALRENASSICDDHGRIQTLKLEREIEAHKAEIERLKATPVGKGPEEKPEVKDEKPAGKEEEKASTDSREKFSVTNRPNVKIGPTFAAGNRKKYTAEELDEVA